MGILSNNTHKAPVTVRVEKRPWQQRQYHPDGRYYILDPKPPPVKNTRPEEEISKNINARNGKKPSATTKPWALSDCGWKDWEPVFHQAAVKFRVDSGGRKKLEQHMSFNREHDGYLHWRCSLERSGSNGTLKVAFSQDLDSRTFNILSVLYLTAGLAPRVATQTSLAHARRTGCTFWTELSPPDCKVVPCCDELCQDVPSRVELSVYEHSLHIDQLKKDFAKRMTELESDQATSIRGFGCKIQKLVKENEVLEERLKDLVRQNRALKSVSRRVGRGSLGMKRGREETVGSDSGCGETGSEKGAKADEVMREVEDSSDDDEPLVRNLKRRRLA